MRKLKRCGIIIGVFLSCIFVRIVHAQLTPPDGGTTWPTNLNSWTFFDTDTWTSDLGYPPISFTNIAPVKLGYGTSVLVDNTNAAWLRYNVFEKDGTTNLTVNQGAITFWFASGAWASTNGGTGPGDWGRLIEVGSYTTNASYGWWSLFLDPGASNLYFGAQTNSGNGAMSTYLSAPVAWNTNEWHFVGLTYSATNSALYLDGVLMTNGLPVTVYPGLNVLTNGFYIGSDNTGVLQARGMFDEIETFNYPLDATTVSNLFAWEVGVFRIDPWNVMPKTLPSGSSSPSYVPTYNAITGSGFLQALSNTLSCITSTNVWLTNLVCTVANSGTNQVATFKFSIAGGVDGAPYDVFADSTLDFSSTTNAPWAWLGQGNHCVEYSVSITNAPTAFLILGNSQDSDHDGLTDAYEKLVSKTNPFNPDTDGDGISDSDEILLHLDPRTANSSLPASLNISICPQ
jgi:Concanavalin A-like lectin/glucanases superfamily/Bacterial TSP3 repeat